MNGTVSLGVAVFPQHGVIGSSTLIPAADAALYRAKAGGRNQVAINPIYLIEKVLLG